MSLCSLAWLADFYRGEEGVFRKEADLLAVSQAACSMPRDIFWLVTDFPTPAQINIRACTVSKLKMVACLFYVNSNVEVSVIDTVLMRVIFTHCYSPNHKAQSVFKGLGWLGL